MISTTFYNGDEEYSAHGEFVFTFDNVVLKLEYTVEEGCIWIADRGHERSELNQKLEKLLDGEKLSFSTMNGNMSFENDNNGCVVLKLASGHSYHGFSIEAKYNSQEFVELFRKSLDDLFEKFVSQ